MINKPVDNTYLYVCQISDIWTPEGYVLGDSDLDYKEWKEAQNTFSICYSDFKIGTDYDFPDWHYNIRSVYVYWYNPDFVKPKSLMDLKGLLAYLKNWFIEFEIDYDINNLMIRQSLMVFENQIVFSKQRNTFDIVRQFGLSEGVNYLKIEEEEMT